MRPIDIRLTAGLLNRGVQWLRRSKRMLLIISPFLAIVVVLLWLATESIDILAAGRAYVEGESLWSKSQKDAVFYLLRFAQTHAESDFHSYEKAMKVPLGFRKARLELQKRKPNYAVVQEGFIAGGTHPDDIPGVIRLYERFEQVSYMQSVLEIWRTGDGFISRLKTAGDQLRALYSSSTAGPAARDEVLSRIMQINEELRPFQYRFSNTLGDATRWIQATLLIVLLTVTSALVPVGVILTQRMVSRVDRAERELKDLKLRQEYAAKLAYHASHDPLTNLLNRLEFENRLRVALDTASTQGRQHVVMFLDLDQFKIVNDTCGHAAGCCARSALCSSSECGTVILWHAWAATSSACCWRTARCRTRSALPTSCDGASPISAS